ncbi:MAG: metal ABC transporter permease [Nitrospirae bacterium]|nr:metal ABC transporter permease [Nitrospirota bacterium]
MDSLGFLVYPFIGCVLLILIHAYFGVHILERGIIFVDLCMAQFIALGVSVSLYMGDGESDRNLYAFVFALIGAGILSLTRKVSRFINVEAFIGVLYVFSLAASILFLDRSPHGLEELKNILNGNIIWLTPKDVLKAALLYAGIGAFHFVFRKRFFALTYQGAGGVLWEFLFFFSFALVLVSSVQMAGILQVFSFLVIPALMGRLYTRRPVPILVLGWIIGILASVFGILVSFRLDLPTAPFIVASLSLCFFALLVVRTVTAGKPERA